MVTDVCKRVQGFKGRADEGNRAEPAEGDGTDGMGQRKHGQIVGCLLRIWTLKARQAS